MSRLAVRRESVVLTLDDRFSTGMAKAAAATMLLDRSLNDLDGTNVTANRGLSETALQAERTGLALQRGSSDLNQFTGRLGLWRDAILSIGPALVPIGAVAIPAVTGLAAAFGFTAIGAGSAAVAFQGVGDALDAMRKAQLEPTTENLQAASAAMEQIGPHAQAFAQQLIDMGPAFREVRDSAAAGLFPGLTESLNHLEPVLPRVASLFEVVGKAVGNLAVDAAEGLNSPQWVEFFAFLEAEAPRALSDLGAALGNVAGGFANMWMAFQPLNTSFVGWLREASQAFQDWSAGLSGSESFGEFVDYIRENGPRVAEALGSIGNAMVQVVQAMAPLGGPVLEMISGLADAVAVLAGSAAGPALLGLAAGMAAVSRATKIMGPGMASLSTAFLDLRTSPNMARTAIERFGGAARVAAGGAGIGLFAHSLTQTNANLAAFEGALGGALAGFAVGGPWGAAIGGVAGVFASLAESSETSAQHVAELTAALTEAKGAIADMNLDPVINQLESTGALGAAEKLGLDLEMVTQAAIGNKAAQDELNAALAGYPPAVQMVSTGSRGAAVAHNEMGAAADKVQAAVNGENEAVNEAAGIFRRAAAAAGEHGDASRDAADGMYEAADGARTLSGALAELSGWLSKREAIRGYEDALKDLKQGLKDGFSKADYDNITAFGRSIEQVANTLKGQARFDFLDKSIAGLRQLAQDAGPKAAAEIRKLIAQLQNLANTRPAPKVDLDNQKFNSKAKQARAAIAGIDSDVAKPKVDLDDGGALGLIGRIAQGISGLNGDTAHTYVYTHFRTTGSGQGQSNSPNVTGPADGGTVGGGRWYRDGRWHGAAEGNTVPKTGLPYADRHPYLLADGEEVISNRFGQADRHRSLLKAINAGRLAEGGTAGASPGYGIPTGSPFSFDLNTPAAALAFAAQAAFEPLATYWRREARLELKEAEQRRDALKKQLDAAREFRDGLRDAARSLKESIADQFSGSDLFSAEDASFGSIMSGLKQNAADASMFSSLTLRLKAMGLDGNALQALLVTGNLSLLQEFAGQSASDLAAFEAQFNRTQQQALQTGETGAWARFGAEQAVANRLLAEARDEFREGNRQARLAEKRLEKLEKWAEREVEATKEVSRAVRGTTDNAGRRGR